MHQGSIFFSKSNIIVKVVIWSVVAAFVLSIFIFAGTFQLNSSRNKEISDNELAQADKRKVSENDRAAVLVTIGGDSKEVEKITVGDFFNILHNQDEQYQKYYSTKSQRENLLDRIIDAKIVEMRTRNIVIGREDYEQEINKIAAAQNVTRAAFDEMLKQRNVSREAVENMFRGRLQEKKFKDELSKPREVSEALMKDYYEKNKKEFEDVQTLPGSSQEVRIAKKFEEVREKIREKLLKEVSDDEIRKYYDEHRGRFALPPSVKLAHIFIKSDSAAIRGSINPSEDEIKQYYEANKSRFKTTRSFEVRNIVKRFDNPEILARIDVSDSEAVDFHARNKAKFMTRASANIKNILIDPKAPARAEALKPTDADLRAFYSETTEVRASHILVNEETLANELKAKIDAGADFAELAKAHSKDPGSGSNGGDLDFFGRGRMVKEFEDTAFALKVNEVSKPVKSQFGYHIIKATAQRTAYEKPFEEVKEEVKNAYIARKLDENAKKLAEDIVAKLKNGGNFAELAREHSDAPSKSNGGVLGVIYQDNRTPIENIDKLTGEVAFNGMVMPQILNAAFRLENNVPSEPVRTMFGYHVIMISDKVEAKEKPYEDCKKEVIDEIKKEKAKTIVDGLMNNVKLRTKVDPFEKLAAEISDGPSAKDGGNVGLIYLGEAPTNYDSTKMVGELVEKAGEPLSAETLEKLGKISFEKEVSDLIALPFGIALVKVEKINEPTFKKLDEIRAALLDEYKNKKAEEIINAKLAEAKAKLGKGEDFAAVCKSYSEGATKDAGGELAEFSKGEPIKDKKIVDRLKGEVLMPWGAPDPAIEEVVYELKTGEVSQIVKSNLGFHLFKALGRSDENFRSFEEVKEKIKQTLTRASLVTDAEIAEYYQQHVAEYMTKERVKVRIIVCGTQQEAEKFHADITKNGKDFAALAREHSLDAASKANGGDMGFITRGQVAPELENEAFKLSKNEVSKVFKTNAGFNIIQVLEKEPAKTASLDEKKNEIRDILIGPKQNEILQEYVNERRNVLNISRKKENFHFLTKYE